MLLSLVVRRSRRPFVCVCCMSGRKFVQERGQTTHRPTDGQNLLPAMLCIKPKQQPPSLPPPSACLGGRGIAKIRHRDFASPSLSLSSGSRCRGRLLTTSRRRRKCRPGSQVFVRFPTFDRFHNFYFLHSVTIFVADLLLTTAKQILVCNTISTKAR